MKILWILILCFLAICGCGRVSSEADEAGLREEVVGGKSKYRRMSAESCGNIAGGRVSILMSASLSTSASIQATSAYASTIWIRTI